MSLRYGALVLIGDVLSGEDCVFLQTSEARWQSFVGEVRPGRTTQFPDRTESLRPHRGTAKAAVTPMRKPSS